MKTLFLHIGMPKAGSTTIQETLFARRLDLAAVGIHYPNLGPSHSKVFLALFSPKKMKLRPRVIGHLGFEKASQDYDLAALERLLVDELTGTDASTVITSGEMLFGFKAGQCRDLRSVLEPHFDRIRILVYLRDPISLATSRAQQNVKGGQSTIAEMGDPGAIRAGRSPLVPRYREPIETWSEAFGADAVVLREFDPRAFAGGDLMVDFGQVVGIPEDLARAMSGLRSKVARNAEAIELLDRYLARTPLAERDRFAQLRNLIEDLPGSRFALPRATLEAVEAAAEPEVAWLRARTGRDIFRRDGTTVEAPPAAWADETLAALQAILGAPVPAIGDLTAAERTAAVDRLLDDLLAAMPRKKTKTKAKFKRGRLGRWLTLAAGLPGYLRQRWKRFLKRRSRGRRGLGDAA